MGPKSYPLSWNTRFKEVDIETAYSYLEDRNLKTQHRKIFLSAKYLVYNFVAPLGNLPSHNFYQYSRGNEVVAIMLLEKIKSKILNLTMIEWVMILSLVVLGFVLGIRYASGPKYWDDLLYINTAWNMDKVAGLENRYSTVFLLPIFTSLAHGNPLLGAKYFGVFTFMSILALVYINARLMAKSNKILIGLLSVLLMLTFNTFVEDLGVVLADYTVTMMMLIGVLVYQLYFRKARRPGFLLIIFGMILVFSFKAKETGLFLGLLIPGFFVDSEERHPIKNTLRKIGWLAAGILLGILAFIFLDWVFLKDALFGLKPSDVNGFVGLFKENALQGEIPTANYLGYLFSSSVFIISLVYFLRSDPQTILKTRWIWLLAIGVIIFLDLSQIHGNLDTIYPRYLTPVVAFLSILSPQILSCDTSEVSRRGKIWNTLKPAGSLILGAVVTFILYFFVERYIHWTFEYLLSVILIPLASCLLLLAGVFFRSKNSLYQLVMAFLIGIAVIPGAVHNLYKVPSNNIQVGSRFSPLESFKGSIDCGVDNILFSRSIHSRNDLFARDLSSSVSMYNLYYGCHKTENDLSFEEQQANLYNDLSMNSYNYVFLDSSDIDFLLKQPDKSKDIFSRYHISSDKKNNYYLLSLNPN